MPESKKQDKDRYQLRHAAGIYWLLDMEQPGVPYVKPVPMNEMGADIWKMHCDGLDTAQIAERLSDTYSVARDQADTDVRTFLDGLEKQGIL